MDFLEILEKLTDRGTEFVIVGGVAARLYGSTRLTHNVDIVPKLELSTWPSLVDRIWALGGRPRIPESLESIKNLKNIKKWMQEKEMPALTFRSEDGTAEIDLLINEPRQFENLKLNATTVEHRNRTYLIASIPDLINMKRRAGRPQDLLDIEQLEAIHKISKGL